MAAEQAAVVSLGVQLEDSQQRSTALERQLEAMRQLPGQLAELQVRPGVRRGINGTAWGGRKRGKGPWSRTTGLPSSLAVMAVRKS